MWHLQRFYRFFYKVFQKDFSVNASTAKKTFQNSEVLNNSNTGFTFEIGGVFILVFEKFKMIKVFRFYEMCIQKWYVQRLVFKLAKLKDFNPLPPLTMSFLKPVWDINISIFFLNKLNLKWSLLNSSFKLDLLDGHQEISVFTRKQILF